MPEENLNQDGEDTSKLGQGSESNDNSLDDFFADEDESKGETLEEKVARMEAETAQLKKAIAKGFSEKGREKAQQQNQAKNDNSWRNDDVIEMFFENKPEAELVKDDLQMIADAKYNGSILKAWKGEKWLQEKASSVREENIAKGKIQPPSQGSSAPKSMESIYRLGDEEQAQAIKKMSNAEYTKWKEYLRRNSNSQSGGMLTL